MKQLFRKEVLIGLIVIIALAILFVGIDFLKGVNIFKAANYYTATYTNVEGLAISAPVTVNGFKVGLVREINYEYDNPGHVKVEISLDKNLKVPKGTQAVIKSDMLGTASIELKMAANPEFHAVGDELQGVVAKGLMDNVSNTLMPSVNSILPKIDSLLTSINTIVADPALVNSMKRLDAITANLEVATGRLSSVMAALPPVTDNVRGITGNLVRSTNDLSAISAKLREAPVDSIADNIAYITANLRQLSEQLNDPNSSIGKLTSDPALYNAITSTISSLDSLFVDIKKNPKRYINIKLL